MNLFVSQKPVHTYICTSTYLPNNPTKDDAAVGINDANTNYDELSLIAVQHHGNTSLNITPQ